MNQHRKIGTGRKIGALSALGAGATLLAGCDVAPPDNGFFNLLRFGWPQGVTPEAQSMGNFWVWTWVAAWIVGIIVWGLLFFSMFKFTAKKAEKAGEDEFPRQTAYNVPLELSLTFLPILIVMGLFFFTVQTQDEVTSLDKDPEVTIDVTGFQWNWKFGYGEISSDLMGGGGDYDGRIENPSPEQQFTREHGTQELTDEDGNVTGTQADYPIHGQSASDYSYLRFDEIETLGTTEEIPVLVLPADTPIEFDLASRDVIHSFWVPEFLFKRDVFPHPEANKSQRVFQIEEINSDLLANRGVNNPSDEVNNALVGRCAEMCGTYHAMMNFEVRVVSREDFSQYIQFRMDNPEATNAQALAEIGEPPYAVSTSPFNSSRTETRDMGDRGANTVDLNAQN